MRNYEISQARAYELLNYDPETGVFTWKERRGRIAEGTEAGHVQAGYRKVTIDKHQIKLHRLAWFMVRGEWPKGEIDHINGDKLDNRIANLRDVAHSINMQNRYEMRKKDGLPMGVKRTGNLFAARIQVGLYATAEEASRAYLQAKRLIHEGCSHLPA